MHSRQRASWVSPMGYAASHCRQCEAGWTRTGKEGGVLTVCLLDREPVLADMQSCDRFEAKPQPVTAALSSTAQPATLSPSIPHSEESEQR